MNRFGVYGLIATFLVAGAALAAEEKQQTKCPVMGGTIDRATSPRIDFQGQRIYFCCPGCPATFKADPEKYFAQFEKEKIVLENIQTVCPVSGETIAKKESFKDYKGRRIYFCCPGCEAPFMKEPEKFLQRLGPVPEMPENKSSSLP